MRVTKEQVDLLEAGADLAEAVSMVLQRDTLGAATEEILRDAKAKWETARREFMTATGVRP